MKSHFPREIKRDCAERKGEEATRWGANPKRKRGHTSQEVHHL
jgi:hypothetical protein